MSQQSETKGFAILALAGITVKILSLLYIPLLLAIIKDEGFGIYAAAYQVYVLIYVISNSGVPVSISKLVSELMAVGNHKDAIRSFKIARFLLLLLGILMALVMFVFAKPLSVVLHFEKSYLAIMALSPTLLFTAVSSAYRGYFQGRGNMTPTAISQFIEQVVNSIFTLVFAALLMRYGLEAACAGGTIGTAVGALFAAVFLVSYHRKNDRFRVPKGSTSGYVQRFTYSQLVKKVISSSVPITLCIGMQYAGSLVDLWNTKSRLLHAHIADDRATQLYGYLYKYQQLLNAPIAITVALAATILPAISAAVALRDRNQVQQKVDFALRLCFMVTIPAAVGFSVLSFPLFELLKYGPGAYLMEFGSVALVLLALIQVQTSILQGAGRLYTVTLNLVIGIVIKIAANYFLISIPQLNIQGAVIGSIFGNCIPIALNFFVIRKVLKIRVHLVGLLIRPAAAALFMGASVFLTNRVISAGLFFIPSTYLIHAVATLLSIFVGAGVYFLVLVWFGGFKSDDLEVLPGRVTRLLPAKLLSRIRENG